MAKKLIHFAGYKFVPNLNPEEMFTLGVHGGSFFHHCDPNFNNHYPIDKRGKQSKKYDHNLNYYGVYPAKLLKASTVTINHKEIHDITISFMEWYHWFYNGKRTHYDNDWIALHTELVRQAFSNIKNYLITGSKKEAERDGQLLIELAINPGFESTI